MSSTAALNVPDKEPVTREFCLQLPKVELHAHINGSISESTMKELTGRKGISYDPKSRLMFKKGESGTLDEAFKMFKMIHNVSDNTDAVYKITYDVIHEFAEDNVKYLELRTTPRAEPSTGMTKIAYVETVLKAIQDCANEDVDIIVRLLLAIDRRHTLEVAMETVEMAVKYREISNGVVVGIDLSGDPNKGNASDFIPAFREAKNHGLKLALHLAEVPAPNETLEVLQVIPDRIGHGTCIQSDTGGSKEIEQFVIDNKIPIELCMSSNITTMTVEGFDNHHFKYWYDIGHPCIICTDDKGVFTTSLPEEYSIVAETFNMSREQLWKLSYDSINYIFSDSEMKSVLQKKWNDIKPADFGKNYRLFELIADLGNKIAGLLAVVYAASAATTTAAATSTVPKILYDMKHHRAMIVGKDGCYGYYLKHQDLLDTENDDTKSALETRMLAELSAALNIQEIDHHHIDHMTPDIQSACGSVPVYSWDIPPFLPMMTSSGSSTLTSMYRTLFQLTVVFSLMKLFAFVA